MKGVVVEGGVESEIVEAAVDTAISEEPVTGATTTTTAGE